MHESITTEKLAYSVKDVSRPDQPIEGIPAKGDQDGRLKIRKLGRRVLVLAGDSSGLSRPRGGRMNKGSKPRHGIQRMDGNDGCIAGVMPPPLPQPISAEVFEPN